MTNPDSTCCGSDCCSTDAAAPATAPAADAPTGHDLRVRVREGYAAIAETATRDACGCGPGCCAPGTAGTARRVGYDDVDLATLPDTADMGLSCGNPTALAALRAGEVVLDLGAGGGLDVFLAGQRVGPAGRAIGVDMTPAMLDRARRGVPDYRARTGLDNVEFRLGEIEHLPLPDASVDVVISNCVINLSPDKPQVWREIARVLRPGGRVAVSDLALLRPLPAAVRTMLDSWIGCIAGANLVDEIRAMARDAGLVDLAIRPRPEYVAQLESMRDPLYLRIAAALPAGTTLAEFVTSAEITARRPG